MIGPIESFLATTTERPPTADDLFTLVRGLGWTINAMPDGKASLRVPDAADPLPHRIAKMLKREPWRSEVLKLANGNTTAADPATVVTKEPNYADRIRPDPTKAPA